MPLNNSLYLSMLSISRVGTNLSNVKTLSIMCLDLSMEQLDLKSLKSPSLTCLAFWGLGSH